MTDGVDRVQGSTTRGPGIPKFNANEITSYIGDEIGKGSYGVIYSLNGFHNLALKEISIIDYDNDALKTVKFQMSVITKLSHPAIIKYHQVIEYDNFIYIVMDRYHENLSNFINKSKRHRVCLSKEWLYSVIEQIAVALDYLCNFSYEDPDYGTVSGIVHRDIKPDNILVDESGKHVVLTDFGLCKNSVHSESTLAGTKPYMAPETLIHNETSAASDVWSLAVIIYEITTMKKLNFLNGKSAADVFVSEWKPDLRAVTDGFIRAILESIFVLNPKERPTARDLIDLFKTTDSSIQDLGIQVKMLKLTLCNANIRISSLEKESQLKSNRITTLEKELEEHVSKLNDLEQKFTDAINSLKTKISQHGADVAKPSSTSSIAEDAASSSSEGKKFLGKIVRAAMDDSPDGISSLLTVLALKKIYDDIMDLDDSSSDKGITDLMRAADKGDVEMVKQLLPQQQGQQAKAKVLVRGLPLVGRTALMGAAARGHTEVVRILVDHEGGMRDERGWTSLMIAALNNHPECVELLLEKESGMQKDDGYTALMLAANNNNQECARLLIDKEKDMQNKKGETALDIAINNDYGAIVAMLLEQIPDTN